MVACHRVNVQQLGLMQTHVYICVHAYVCVTALLGPYNDVCLSCSMVLYSSDAQATLQPLPMFAPPKPAPSQLACKLGQIQLSCLGQGDESIDTSPPTYRVDMDDGSGEVFLLKYQPRTAEATVPSSTCMARDTAGMGIACQDDIEAAGPHAAVTPVWALFAGASSSMQLDVEDSAFFEKTGAVGDGCNGPGTQHAGHGLESGLSLHLAVYSIAERRLIDQQEFMDSRRLVSVLDNAYVPMQSSLPLHVPKQWKHQVRRCAQYHSFTCAKRCCRSDSVNGHMAQKCFSMFHGHQCLLLSSSCCRTHAILTFSPHALA